MRGLPLPRVITVPFVGRLERHAYLFWRVRLPLWVVLGAAGWLLFGWAGLVPGFAAALATELVFSYRRPGRRPGAVAYRHGPGGPGGGASGVREPRRPRPSSGSGAAALNPSHPTTG